MSVSYDLYIVTDKELSNGLSHQEVTELCCKGNVDVIQLRDKNIDDSTFLAIAKDVREITKKYGVTFIVNDRVEIAIECNADGVHVGQSDCPVSEVRKIVPKNFIIGCSAGNVEEALKAESDGADYVAVSPVFDTKSKLDADPGHGLATVTAIRNAVKVPVIGIGGINAQNAESVIKAGADGISVISAVVSQPDVEKAAKELGELVRASKARL